MRRFPNAMHESISLTIAQKFPNALQMLTQSDAEQNTNDFKNQSP
jgi:hypothetical protein